MSTAARLLLGFSCSALALLGGYLAFEREWVAYEHCGIAYAACMAANVGGWLLALTL